MIFAIVVAFLSIIVYIYLKYKETLELGNKIPGPWHIPLLGNAQFLKLTPETLFLYINKYQKCYKDCFRLWLGTQLWVFIHDPKQIEDILNDRDLIRADDFHKLRPLIGEGLLLADGRKWSCYRRSLSFAFSTTILSDFFPAFSKHADVLISKLATDKSVEVTDYALLCVLDMICETSMGANINSQLDPQCAYVRAFHDASHILFKRMSNPFMKSDFIFYQTSYYKLGNEAIETIHKLTRNIIQEKRQKLVEGTSDFQENGCRKKLALLDVLLQSKIDGQPMTDQHIEDNVNTFLFAGIDTTKSAVSFLLYNIGKYQHVQNKLYEEIVALIGSDPKQEIQASYLADLPYLDRVVNESLRFHTTVPTTARQTTKTVRFGNYTYPKNTSLWINIYGLAHDPAIFERPYEFLPERFETSEWIEKYGSSAFIPFSAGPRICIGKKYSIFIIKTIAIKVLLNYEITLKDQDEELQLMAEMVLKSMNGINLKFKKRSIY